MTISNQKLAFVAVLIISVLPFCFNLFGVEFGSKSIGLKETNELFSQVTADDQFFALRGALHHALLEWSAVILALLTGFISFVHYFRYHDISIPIIGLALLCAGFTDAFHTLAATRIISANVPNADFIPFTWAFSRIFNASLMMMGVSLSLWITSPSRQFAKSVADEPNTNRPLNTKKEKLLLGMISLGFISMAIVSVIIAATSSVLPQTTFVNALITRPYDVVPLALFIFSATLVYAWYKRKASVLKYALLLSIIPEVATQLHMSFGSNALFDNHFNIAHGLKVVAYAVLTIGLIVSLIRGAEESHQSGQSLDNIVDKYAVDGKRWSAFSQLALPSVGDELLDVGTAKYPQVLLISSFTFILAIVISVFMASIFYVDTAKLTKQQQLKELKTHGDFIEPLIKGIYHRAEEDIQFISHTPPFQGIIRALKRNDRADYQLWIERLRIILEEKVISDVGYIKISYIKLSDNKQLISSFREGNQVNSIPQDKLEIISDPELLAHSQIQQGNVYYYYSSLTGNGNTLSGTALNVMKPIIDEETKENFGYLSIKLNFHTYVKRLKLASLSEQRIYLTDKSGKIIFKVVPDESPIQQIRTKYSLQQLYPELKNAIISDLDEFQLNSEINFTPQTTRLNGSVLPINSNISGHFRTIQPHITDRNNLVHLFIRLDQKALDARLAIFRFRGLLVSFSLAIISLALAVFVSRRLSEPLGKITEALTEYGYTGKAKNLPVNANDETGVLARSFHNILVIKAQQDKEIIQKQAALDEHAIVSIANVKGEVLFVNDKFVEISGFSRNELLGQDHRMLNSGYHGIEFFKDMYQTIAGGKVWHSEICNKAKDGHLYWVDTTIVPFTDNQGKPERYISIRTDITRMKESGKVLAVAKDELSYRVLKLQEANAELDQFAYVASHDLKSPLNGISQLVGWLEEDCADILPVESKEHLSLLRSRSRRMMALLSDLLNYSRIGRKDHKQEEVYLAAIVDDIFELQGDREGFICTAPNVKLIVQKAPFELVVRNLISNAIKHHDKDHGKIEFSFAQKDGFYEVRVQDDGPGIPPKLQEKAMEMFQTLQSRDKTEGSGMGLALVKKTVMKQGGSLSIDSDGGRGTIFIVKWPAGRSKS